MSHKTNLFETFLESEYFMNLGDYNKTQISQKQPFYSDFQDSPQSLNPIFLSILNHLQYNLDFNTTNYKYGQRIFNNNLKDFSWITTNENKSFTISYYDKSSKNEVVYDKKMLFTEKEFQEHFLGYNKSNRYISFAYKAFYKEDLKKQYDESLKNMYKIHKKTYGSTQSLNSDILWLDIDNRDDISAIETLGLFLDYFEIDIKELIYLEQNRFTGGIHTALKLPYKITNTDFYSNLEKALHIQGIDIECNFINNVLRFPLSYEYNPIIKDDKIFSFDEFIPESFYIKKLENFINTLSETKTCFSEKLIQFIEIYQPIDKKVNYWNIKRKLFQKSYKSKFKPNFYKITEGNRYNVMSKLIPYAKALGYNKDQIIDIIYENNINSKDLSKWSKKRLENNISNFYNKSNLEFLTNNKHKGFISNEYLLDNRTKEFLTNPIFVEYFTNRFINEYLLERRKHNSNINKLSDMKINNLKQQLPLFLIEIFGSMYYQVKNEKHCIDESLKPYLGFQLSETHLKSIQDYINQVLDIDNELKNTSIQYLKKSLFKALSLKEIELKNHKRNWVNGSCKSYYIKSINDIYNCLNHLYNSCFTNNINNIFLNKLNKKDLLLNILYISLVENTQFFSNDDENILKKIIDIDDK